MRATQVVDSSNQPFHPTMMVKVLIYGYATGVFSSRKIVKKLHEDVAFRVLGANNFPAISTDEAQKNEPDLYTRPRSNAGNRLAMLHQCRLTASSATIKRLQPFAGH